MTTFCVCIFIVIIPKLRATNSFFHRPVPDAPIFSGLKAFTLSDPKQQSLLRLALEGISVYSPHTAVDAAPGGNADWMADIVTGTLTGPEPATHTAEAGDEPNPDVQLPVRTLEDGSNVAESKCDGQGKQEAREVNGQGNQGGLKPPQPKQTRPGMTRNYSQPTYPQPKSGCQNENGLEP
jgi:putative NIF3 family GTP cyclohydrolase 1 type 2